MGGKLTFDRLFQPINIGEMTVRNRIAMAPMGTGFATKDGLVTEQMKGYYEARAKGGAGLVIVENASVDFYQAMQVSNRLCIDNEMTLQGLTELAQVIKKHGARVAIQLNHSGRQAQSKLGGFQPVAPSPIPYPGGSTALGETPRELTVKEIHEIVDRFASAASRAKKAGFDGIEVHAAHGYLIAQFLSPFSNKRDDMYGGDVKKRARILIEVLRAIRESVGKHYPLWCRINGQEYGVEGGFSLSDSIETAKMVNGIVDAIHVSAFGYGGDSLVTLPDTPGALLPLAQAIKKAVDVPVIAVGKLTLEVGEMAVRDGKADIIIMGRALITDPETPNKASLGRLDDIRPCIACFYCQDMGSIKNSPVVCAVNATVGREREYKIRKSKEIKKIAIIGGGPGGMESARVLALRGHEVVLFEKENRLGGQMRLAMVPPHKRERIEPFLVYLVTQLTKLDVEIRLSTEANIEDIKKLKPDTVLLATGAEPLIPRIPGVDLDNVVTATAILAGRAEAGRKVVIVGGGSIVCETAEFLFEKGKEVTVVEMLPQLAVDAGFRDRVRLLARITTLPINFMTNASCIELRKGETIVTIKENKEQSIRSDTVVLAAGSKQNNSLYPLLKASGFETHLVGDCWRIGRIAEAVGDGFRLGCAL